VEVKPDAKNAGSENDKDNVGQISYFLGLFVNNYSVTFKILFFTSIQSDI